MFLFLFKLLFQHLRFLFIAVFFDKMVEHLVRIAFHDDQFHHLVVLVTESFAFLCVFWAIFIRIFCPLCFIISNFSKSKFFWIQKLVWHINIKRFISLFKIFSSEILNLIFWEYSSWLNSQSNYHLLDLAYINISYLIYFKGAICLKFSVTQIA